MKKTVIGLVSSFIMLTSVSAQAQHHGHHHHHGHRHDVSRWVIPAIISGAVLYAATRPVESTPVPIYIPQTPQSYPVQTCTTREVFDQYGRKISSERTCY